MIYRVMHPFRHAEQDLRPGQIVEINRRSVMRELMDAGVIADVQLSSTAGDRQYNTVRGVRTKRIGMWLETSRHYSGGRIHLWQYLWCMAEMGCECWMFTNRSPLWAKDYPHQSNIHITVGGGVPPDDIDICITDSKGHWGDMAADYARTRSVPLVVMNFETPNWVAKYVPDHADRLSRAKPTHFKHGDLLFCNSDLSLKFALDWFDRSPKALNAVLPPAINEYAVAASADSMVGLPQRPYAVWSGRAQRYKGGASALDCIFDLDIPFDVVVFGGDHDMERSDALHTVYQYQGGSDADKYRLMANAHMVVAPSLFEGFGMVPAEALAVGTPCVVYDLPVLRWAYGDRLEYVRWNDRKAFTRQVSEMARVEKKDVGRSKDYVASKYSLRAMESRLERVPYHHMNRRSVSAHMIAYSCGAGLPEYAVRSVYDHVDEIVIAYGPVPQALDWPEDGTLAALGAMPDPDKKIRIEARDEWKDKLAMRQWCADQITGNYFLELDGDELWTGLDKWNVDFGTPRWVNFWHGPDHYVTEPEDSAGRRWGRPIGGVGSGCPHWRWSWWRPSDRFLKHTRVTAMPKDVPSFVEHNHRVAAENPGTVIWHLGHALPRAWAERKLRFYEDRDGAPDIRKRAWLDWNGSLGDCGDGIVRAVDFDVPAIVRRAFDHLGGLEDAE